MFDSPWNKMIMIGNETDLHYKVVQLIRIYYPNSILVAGLGENQDTEDKRLDSCKKGCLSVPSQYCCINFAFSISCGIQNGEYYSSTDIFPS